MQDFRKLAVWRKAFELALEVYRATAGFPAAERFGLIAQARGAAASMGANIAEGCGRGGRAEFRRFLQISMGSASELEFHLLLARDLKYLSSADHERLQAGTEEVKRMLASLIARLKERIASASAPHD